MKKIALILAIVMLFTLTATGCGKIRGVEIDYGTSEMYTEDEMNDAIPAIFPIFMTLYEGELETLTYAGDDVCKKTFENDEYLFSYLDDVYAGFDNYMVFYSDVKLTKHDKNGEIYYKDKKITWILGSNGDHSWVCIDRKKTKLYSAIS